MSNKKVLLDIMLDDRFVCQLRYTKRGFPQMVDGKVVEGYDYRDLEDWVLDKRPSLKGKNIKIAISDQEVIRK